MPRSRHIGSTASRRNRARVLSSRIAEIREIAAEIGTTIEMLAMAAALARPWASFVLSGAATVDQIKTSAAALNFGFDGELDEKLRPLALDSNEYWRARSGFAWN